MATLKGTSVSGDLSISGLTTTSSANTHKGIKIGNTYINAINGSIIFQNNEAIRFGTDAWDWDQWAGLKYVHSSKKIVLGLADNSEFTANSIQSGGTFKLAGISTIDCNTTASISNLPIGGGLYWNPYVESSTDATDAASITLIKDGNGTGGTVLQIKQANDSNDIINLVAGDVRVNGYSIIHSNNIGSQSVNYASSAGSADSASSSGYLNALHDNCTNIGTNQIYLWYDWNNTKSLSNYFHGIWCGSPDGNIGFQLAQKHQDYTHLYIRTYDYGGWNSWKNITTDIDNIRFYNNYTGSVSNAYGVGLQVHDGHGGYGYLRFDWGDDFARNLTWRSHSDRGTDFGWRKIWDDTNLSLGYSNGTLTISF